MDKEKYFNSNKNQIQKVMDFVLNSESSDFYREKYRAAMDKVRVIDDYKTFFSIPTLDKDELLTSPPGNNLYHNKVNFFSFSSGTTSQKHPLAMPHIHNEEYFNLRFNKDLLEELGANRILILVPPTMGAVANIMTNNQRNFSLTLGDINNFNLTKLLAKEVGINGIFSTPTILELFREKLDNDEVSRIKWIAITGEVCSRIRYLHLSRLFPNALILNDYGSAELGGIAYQCKEVAGDPLHLHGSPHLFFETNDLGELLVTDLEEPIPFPLIRYNTKDMGEVRISKCSCGAKIDLILKGKRDYKKLKFNGLVVQAEMLEKALVGVSNLIKPNYQMIVRETEEGGKIVPEFKLIVEAKSKTNVDKLEQLVKEELGRKFFISAGKNLFGLAEEGVIKELKVQIAKENELSSKKRPLIQFEDN